MHILSPETDNCPSWISGRERMTIENISWSISMEECRRSRRGWTRDLLVSSRKAHPTEPPRPAQDYVYWDANFFPGKHKFHHAGVPRTHVFFVDTRQKSRSRETNKHPQIKSALILLRHAYWAAGGVNRNHTVLTNPVTRTMCSV